ncbi:hypothetical protein ES332_D01G058300v1 [Gossypium tomentosum]|uniref:Uncharacterized protein n=1 Tax=Gossypium tomentosum TaxID=34277 RepID=A0A5D2M5P2_GOSTO|nr:hypothetical protein ES332_D01G058300v1 [Gossypium tomentosum]
MGATANARCRYMARSTCRFGERPAGGGRLRAWCALEAHGSSKGCGALG